MHKMAFSLLLISPLLSLPAGAEVPPPPAEVSTHVPEARIIAFSRFSYLLWDIYDATLFIAAQQGKVAPPFALRLEYHMDFSGREITNRSIQEIRRQGHFKEMQLAQWHSLLLESIPDITAGQALTGVVSPDLSTRFYHDGVLVGTVTDPDFTIHFFNIWLGRHSSDTSLRRQLTSTTSGELPCVPDFCN
jgi:hypothetical protein